jgi:putative glutamine amidotransferase
MKPVIAIPETGKGMLRKYKKRNYVRSLLRAGAEILWINLEDLDAAVAQTLRCDGLLLTGGTDVDPHRYGQEPTEKCQKPDKPRDEAEFRLLEAYLPTGKPTLCVCRGEQLLNVHFGGTLHQDIQDIQVVKHRVSKAPNKGVHGIKIYPKTLLSRILGEEPAKVNSLHHQAVDRLGPGLKVSAVSDDGFVEAVEVFLHPFCLGVQWHPENMSKTDPRQQKIFDAFVKACGK